MLDLLLSALHFVSSLLVSAFPSDSALSSSKLVSAAIVVVVGALSESVRNLGIRLHLRCPSPAVRSASSCTSGKANAVVSSVLKLVRGLRVAIHGSSAAKVPFHGNWDVSLLIRVGLVVDHLGLVSRVASRSISLSPLVVVVVADILSLVALAS